MIVIPNNVFFEDVSERIAQGDSVTIPLKGRSMEPLLQTGDILTLEPLHAPLCVGDVILFRYDRSYVLHRIVALNGDEVVAQGDACHTQERFVKQDVVAVLSQVRHADGIVVRCDSRQWQHASRKVLQRRDFRLRVQRLFNASVRRKVSPWYFLLLAILMWAPLGGVPLDSFVLGLRLDHLLHASIYIPCTWFLMDSLLHFDRGSVPFRRKVLLLLCGFAIACLTEGVQWLLPYRGFDINDLAANFIGVTFGWLLCRWFSFRR